MWNTACRWWCFRLSQQSGPSITNGPRCWCVRPFLWSSTTKWPLQRTSRGALIRARQVTGISLPKVDSRYRESTAVTGILPLQGLVSQKSTAAAACSFYVQRRLSWEGNPVQNRESSQHLHSTLSSNAWKNYPHYTAHQRQHSRSLHSSLFYGCGTWPTYMRQKRKLNSGHMRSAQCSRRHLDKIKNEVILQLNGCIAPCLVN